MTSAPIFPTARAAGVVLGILLVLAAMSIPLGAAESPRLRDPNPVIPSAGSIDGGTAVRIFGTGFEDGATVEFNNVPAINVVWVSETELTAVTPPGDRGPATVRVTNPDNSFDIVSGAFTYLDPAPTVTSISPTVGPTSGGTSVSITGEGFESGAIVLFGSIPATTVVRVSAQELVAVTPARAAGTVHVEVRNPLSATWLVVDGFRFIAPAEVTGISPSSGPTAGGTAVTISGTGFTAGSTVTIGGLAATDVEVAGATTITALTPARSAGAATVAVRSPEGILADGTVTFTYVHQAVTHGTIPTLGFGVFRFGGGTTSDLVTAAQTAGCPASEVAFFATVGGRYVVLIPLAPAFVNAEWDAAFPDGVPNGTWLLARCR